MYTVNGVGCCGVGGFLDSLDDFAESALGRTVLGIGSAAAGAAVAGALGGGSNAQASQTANLNALLAQNAALQRSNQSAPQAVQAVATPQVNYLPWIMGGFGALALVLILARK